MTLRFNATTHRYTCDGRPIPGVTSLIKGGLPAPALTYWSAKTVAEYVADNREQVERLWDMGRGPMVAALKETPWQSRDEAASKGTHIHTLAEELVHGREVDVPEYLAGHVESCVKFLDEWQPVPLLSEVSVVNRAAWYAGRLDLIADVPGYGRVLIDWKSNRSGIFAETAFQLAAYRYAEHYALDADPEAEFPMLAVDATWAVHLRADGYDVVPVKADEQTFKEFRHLSFVAGVAKRMKTYVEQALDAPTTQGDAA